MNIVVHSHSNPESHVGIWANAFVKGLKAHGIESSISYSRVSGVSADLVVAWGTRRINIIKEQFKPGCRYLVMERGYFGDRLENTSLGFDGLNNRADFLNKDSLPDRWIKHGIGLMKPWNLGSEYILILGQVPTDFAVALHTDFSKWLQDAVEGLRGITQLPIVFRPHPLGPRDLKAGGAKILDPQGDLRIQLRKAACVVTFNSNSGVDAVLEGIPTITMDEGAMSWEVTAHTLEDVLDPPMPNRSQWAYDLAYCQWTRKEIEEGSAWTHLKKGMRM